MRDATDVLSVIREAAAGAVEFKKMSDIVYGTVLSLSPLEVKVDQKLTIPEDNLKLTRAVLDYTVEMSVDHRTEDSSGGSGDDSFASHSHAYAGRKKFLVHNGLEEGDFVTMIRVTGGQQYVIIDKEVR